MIYQAFQTWAISNEFDEFSIGEEFKKLSTCGYTHVEISETGNFLDSEIREICIHNNLKIIGTHRPPLDANYIKTLIKTARTQSELLRNSFFTVITDPLKRGHESAYIECAKICNQIYEELLKNDPPLRICIHCYAYDFEPLNENGETGVDILLKNTSETKSISLELDTYFLWLVARDSSKFEEIYKKYENRCSILHVSDPISQKSSKEAPQLQQDYGFKPEFSQAPIGRGKSINWQKFLKIVTKDQAPEYIVIENNPEYGSGGLVESYEYINNIMTEVL